MNFITDEQKSFYEKHAAIAKISHEYSVLIYTIGIDRTCREHFSELFDSRQHLIRPQALDAPWQTTGSLHITRLAFNLFTGRIPDNDEQDRYTPAELLSGMDRSHTQGIIAALNYYAG